MRQRVLGSIGLTYGIAALAYAVHNGIQGRTFAYKLGEIGGYALVVVIIYFSGRTIIRAINERRTHDHAAE